MCFNSEDQFDPATGAPARKPTTVNNSDGSIIDKIFNVGASVFDRIATVELEAFEAERLLDIRDAEEQAKIARQQELAGTTAPQTQFLTSQPVLASGGVIGIGMIALAAILLARG